MKRVRRWTVKVSAGDAERLAAAARRVGLPVAAFMRGAAVGLAAAVESEAAIDPKARAELILARARHRPLR